MNKDQSPVVEQNKTRSAFSKYVVAVAFLVFVGGFSLLNTVFPDREFSEKENRVLASFPQFSLYNLFLNKDKWTLNFETYVTDQFPLRDQWVALKSACEKLELKTDNKGVYFAKDHFLIEKPSAPNWKTIDTNISAVNKFAKQAKVPVYFALVPNSIYVNSDKLPAFAYDGEQGAIIERAAQKADPKVGYIDVAGTLLSHKKEYIYYRTDHHWTSLGAYYGYKALSQGMGFDTKPIDAFKRTAVASDFAGTMMSRCGAWWVPTDNIELFETPDVQPSCEIYEGSELKASQQSLYFMDRLKTVDKYTVFLDGNHPLTVIKKGNGETKLLVVKDSFAHSIAPFLACNFSEIHLVDLRYYKNSLKDYIQKNGIDDVLILYSVNNFSTDKNVLFLNS